MYGMDKRNGEWHCRWIEKIYSFHCLLYNTYSLKKYGQHNTTDKLSEKGV